MEAESCTATFNITGGFLWSYKFFAIIILLRFRYVVYCLRLSMKLS